MPVGDPVMFSGRLKTRSGLAGNQNLPFMDGHELVFIHKVLLGIIEICLRMIRTVVFSLRFDSYFPAGGQHAIVHETIITFGSMG